MSKEELGDEEFLQEFVEGSPIWYDSLMDELKERDYCPICGTPPSYLQRLATIIKDKLLSNTLTIKE